VPVIRRNMGHQVHADGEIQVPWIEVAQVVRPGGRDVLEEFLGQIPMRVDEADAVAQRDVLEDQVPEQRTLAATGFADDVNMLALVNGRNAKKAADRPIRAARRW